MKFQPNKLLLSAAYFVLCGCSFGASFINGKDFQNSSTSDPIDENAKVVHDYSARSVYRQATSATVDFACEGTALFYYVSTVTPSMAGSQWIPCPVGFTQLTIDPLQSNINQLKVWTKSAVGISPSPHTIEVVKADHYSFSLPETELSVSNNAGEPIVELTPSRWIIVDPNNDVAGINAGAVHITNNQGQVLKTIRGLHAGDQFGKKVSFESAIVKLQGNRFAVVAPQAFSSDGTKASAGQIRIFDIEGNQLFLIEGDDTNDKLGSCDGNNGFLEHTNGNWFICSTVEIVSGLANAGSLKLFNGSTGALIASINGDMANDRVGKDGTFVHPKQLASGLIAIPTASDSINGGAASVGSIIFMDPTTGAIVSEIRGQTAGDNITGRGVQFLNNGNVVVKSHTYTNFGQANKGRYIYISGTTGLVLANVDADVNEVFFGYDDAVELTNGNVVFSTATFSQNGIVKLINGITGATIATHQGVAGRGLSEQGLITLANGNFVILTQDDQPTGVFGQGSARLINGTTGAEISVTGGDLFGGFQIQGAALANGNYVIIMPDFGGADGGRLTIHSGTSGAILGQLLGVFDGDMMGAAWTIRSNSSNRFVIGFSSMDTGDGANAGCYYMFNSLTGAVVNSRCGDQANDLVGMSTTLLPNGNFLLFSNSEIIGGIAKGQVDLLDGTSGATLASYNGDSAADLQFVQTKTTDVPNILISFQNFDAGGFTNSGKVIIVNSNTGAILNTFSGQSANDNLGSSSTEILLSGNFLLATGSYDYSGLTNAGNVKVIDKNTGLALVDVYGESANDNLSVGKSLSNGDYVLNIGSGDAHGMTDSGRYVLLPMD